jgi:hypothetical protein
MRVPCVVLVVVLAALNVRAAGREPPDPVQVYYPGGRCQTGVLEVEVFSRSLQIWQPHPTHWRILADTCQLEDAGELLNELRVRCVDVDDPARASVWQTGVQVYQPADAPGCTTPQSHAAVLTDPRVLLTSPPADEAVRGISKKIGLKGQVSLGQDIALLLDARLAGDERAAVDDALGRLIDARAPLLGPVQIGIWPFVDPHTPRPRPARAPSPSTSADAIRDRIGRVFDGPAYPGLAAAVAAVLDAHESRSDKTRSLTLLVVVDGRSSLPFGRAAGADPRARSALLDAVERALAMGSTLRIVVLGGDEAGLAELVDRVRESIARHPGQGELSVPEDLAGLAPAILESAPVELRELRVVNLANGVLADDLVFTRAGTFAGDVRLETGRNRLRVRALLSDRRELVADFERDFDASELRDQLRAEEARRIEELRARRGIIEVEVEEP